MTPALSVVMPVWAFTPELAAMTAHTLAQLRDTQQVPTEVIVVDNGSSARGEWVYDAIHRFPENRGIAPAYNAGLAKASAPIVAFLSNDCLVEPGWDVALVQCASAGRHVAFPFTNGVQSDGVGITAWCMVMARDLIEAIGGFDETFVPAWYEDSVAGDTPIWCRVDGEFLDLIPIADLFPRHVDGLQDRTRLRYRVPRRLEVLTGQGWVRPDYVVRHHVQKPLVTVFTDQALIRVTEDHSLFSHGRAVRPADIPLGGSLDCIRPGLEGGHDLRGLSEAAAEAWGFFAAEGHAAIYERDEKTHYAWNMSQKKPEQLLAYREALEAIHGRPFFLRPAGRGMHILTSRRVADLAVSYRDMFYTRAGDKRVPRQILNSHPNVMAAFIRGYLKGDGHQVVALQHNRSCTNSATLAAGLAYLADRCGRSYSVGTRRDKPTIVNMLWHNEHPKNHNARRRGLKPLRRDEHFSGFVYDISTPHGTFVAGTGGVVAHNTDLLHRLWITGTRFWSVPAARVQHQRLTTTGQAPWASRGDWLHWANRFRYAWKHGVPPDQLPPFWRGPLPLWPEA